jgi:aromatic ring-opening dioxygenase catalytic subunit (LigB family)
VLIIGSGLSYHNLRRRDPSAAKPSRRFNEWLQETLMRSHPAKRRERLADWATAPTAREGHPREDHLLPLRVAVGAAEGDAGTGICHEDAFMGSISRSRFRFGGSEGR